MATLGTLAVIIIVPALAVLYREFFTAPRRASILAVAAIAAGAIGIWVLAGLLMPAVGSSALHAPTAALAVVSAFLGALPMWQVTRAPLPALLYSTAWTTLVFVPVAIIVMYPQLLGLSPLAAPLDLGGAIPVHVAAGAAGFVALVARRANPPLQGSGRPNARTLMIAGLILWAGWALLLVGLELHVGEPTLRIVASALIAPLFAIIGWLVVQRVITGTTTAAGATAGLVCGLVAITPGSAYLNLIGAGITGALAGVACAVFVLRRRWQPGDPAWFLIGAHWLAAVVGLVSLAIIGSDRGFVFTGQTGILMTQFFAIVLVSAWAGLAALLLGPIGRLTLADGRAQAPVEQRA